MQTAKSSVLKHSCRYGKNRASCYTTPQAADLAYYGMYLEEKDYYYSREKQINNGNIKREVTEDSR